MALDAFSDSNYTRSMPGVSKGFTQSSDSSNLLHKDEQFQSIMASLLGKATGNLSSTDARISHFNLGKFSSAANQKHEDSLSLDIERELHSLCLKKPRLDCNKDVTLKEYIVKQLMESQGQMALLKALLQHYKLQNGKEELILQSFPQFLAVDVKQHAHKQIRHHSHEPDVCQMPAVHCFDGVCSRRLMQYLYHLRHRPEENSVAYWRKFVEEYYAPHAKQRWCFSLYDNVGHPSSGVFPPEAVAQWHCNICGSRSVRGLEVSSEVLPRLNKVLFESGVIDEIYFLDLPHECRLPSGLMVLEYDKAVQESVYEQLRVVREGKLRIVFTYDLKIQSWEFCARNHEELLLRSFIVPQVSQLVNAAQEYQSTINGSDKVLPHDLQEDCNRLLTTGHQLGRNLDLQLNDDLGFCKSYIRCLQIAGVVESMKDLMTFSRDNNIGPVEALKKYHRQTTTIKPLRGDGKEISPLEGVRRLPTEYKNFVVLSSDFKNSNESLDITCKTNLNGSKEEAPSKLSRQTLKSNAGKRKVAPSHKRKGSNKGASIKPLPNPKKRSSGSSEDLPLYNLSGYKFSESSKNIQECMAQKWLQKLISKQREEDEGDEEVNHHCTTSISGLQTKARIADKLISEVDFNSMVSAAVSRNSSSSGRNMQNVSTASSRESSSVFGNDDFIKREQVLLEMMRGYNSGLL